MLSARVGAASRLARGLLSCRHASTSSNPYPYPSNANPTPHQIFHLPRTATLAEVKSRYYELVRIYHPDSQISRHFPAAKAQARFHAIKAAYDALRGKTPLSAAGEPVAPKKDYHDLSTAMWKAKQRRRAELNVGIDDKWKDRLMISVVSLALAAFVAQAYVTRSKALSSARDRARQARKTTSDSQLQLALPVKEDGSKA